MAADDSEEGEEEPSPLQARPVGMQKMKSQQPKVPEGNPAGPTQMAENTKYPPHMQAKLVHLVKQFRQRPRKSLAAWLLHHLDLEVSSSMCTDQEMEKLASIMTHPSLRQRL